jgi:hypothetical protein
MVLAFVRAQTYPCSWVLLTPLLCDMGKVKDRGGGRESHNVLFRPTNGTKTIALKMLHDREE